MCYAIITGASKGIGKAIAKNLAARNYNVLLVARSEDQLSFTAGEIKSQYPQIDVQYFALDLSERNAGRKLLEWVQQNNFPVCILVNNAGYGLSGEFDKYTEKEYINMLDLNIITLTKLTYHFLPLLRRESQAYILNIASIAAYQAVPYLSLYAASKSFVLAFSRGLHQELLHSNVSVTCVSPGPTDTYFITRAGVGDKGVKAAEKVNMTPEAVAEIAVKALFNKRAEVITGFLNKLSAFMAWLLPKSWVERIAMQIYR